MGFKKHKKLNNGYYDFNIYIKNIKNEKQNKFKKDLIYIIKS